jgi:hypothetical protein
MLDFSGRKVSLQIIHFLKFECLSLGKVVMSSISLSRAAWQHKQTIQSEHVVAKITSRKDEDSIIHKLREDAAMNVAIDNLLRDKNETIVTLTEGMANMAKKHASDIATFPEQLANYKATTDTKDNIFDNIFDNMHSQLTTMHADAKALRIEFSEVEEERDAANARWKELTAPENVNNLEKEIQTLTSELERVNQLRVLDANAVTVMQGRFNELLATYDAVKNNVVQKQLDVVKKELENLYDTHNTTHEDYVALQLIHEKCANADKFKEVERAYNSSMIAYDALELRHKQSLYETSTLESSAARLVQENTELTTKLARIELMLNLLE